MILILKMKHGDYPVYARNEAEKGRAYLHLFNLMDRYGYYFSLNGDQGDWYKKAKQNDAQAAQWLLEYRSYCQYEYERIEEIYPVEP
ncbi:MAG: hypothetical protein ACYSUB_01880 [Planctomycetota bacterium]|jgi:hypothetical protein